MEGLPTLRQGRQWVSGPAMQWWGGMQVTGTRAKAAAYQDDT